MFDRTTWIAIALSVAGLVGWQYYYNKTYGPYLAQQAALHKQAKETEAAKATPSATPVPVAKTTVLPPSALIPSSTAHAPAPVAAATPSIPEFSTKRATIDTSRAEYLFAANTGGIETVTLFLHLGANEQSLFLNKDSGMPIGALCDGNGNPIGGFAMSADKGKGTTSFSLSVPGGLAITKSFTLPQAVGSPEEYLIGLDLSFKNTGTTPLTFPATLSPQVARPRSTPTISRPIPASTG